MRIPSIIVFLLLLLSSLLGCEEKRSGVPLPDGEFQFPASVLVHPSGYALVSSSNFDLAYESGSLRLVDLNGLRLSDLNNPDPDDPTWSRFVLDEEAIGLDDFAGAMRLSSDGRFLVTADREKNRLVLVDLSVDEDGSLHLNCWTDGRRPEGRFPKCDGAMHLVNLDAEDPFGILLFDVEEDGDLRSRRAVVSYLRSESVSVWDLPISGSLEVPSFLYSLELGENVAGASDMAYSAISDRVFIGSRYAESNSNPLHFFKWGMGAASELMTEDLFNDILGSEIRGLQIDADGTTLAVLMRNPDLLVFLDTRSDAAGEPTLDLLGEVLVDDNPSTLRRYEDTYYVLNTKDDTILAVDARTRRLLAKSEEICRGPYDMDFWVPGDVSWGVVACFEDNTLSIINIDRDSPDFMQPVVRVGREMEREY